MRVDPTSAGWRSPESRYRRVLDHLGAQYFFDRTAPGRTTVAPDFSALMPVPRTPPGSVA